MPDISVGKITKAVNSTQTAGYQPAVSDANALLLDPCDVRHPVFKLKGSAANYNYAKWGSRYYWVDRVVPFPNGIIEVHCHIDPLATYKNDIKDTYAYCLFHSTSINAEADDPRFSPEKVRRNDGTVVNIFDSAPTPTGGCVILTVMESGLGSSNQGVKTYALSLSDFRSMLLNLQSSIYDTAYNNTAVANSINNNVASFSTPDDVANMVGAVGTSVIHSMLKGLSDIIANIGGMGSWRDNLIKAIYVPFTPTQIPSAGSDKNIYLGFLDTGKSARLVDPVSVKTKSGSVMLPWDQLCNDYHFLKYGRFSQFQAICCGGQYATFSSDTVKDLAYGSSIGFYSAVDMCSGDWGCVLTTDTSASNKMRLASFGGCMGIDITGLAGSGGFGAGMNFTLGGFKLAANALSLGLTSNFTQASSGEMAGQIGTGIVSNYLNSAVGSVGSGVAGNGITSIFLNGSAGYNDLLIQGICSYPAIVEGTAGANYDDYCGKYGYPCNSYKKLSLDGSFVVCSGAFVECEGSQEDQAYINSVLNSGILLEA